MIYRGKNKVIGEGLDIVGGPGATVCVPAVTIKSLISLGCPVILNNAQDVERGW